ncbi:ABC transporter ATP-binding protein [Domibacillus aminovorans]|uniref:Glycerol-3-phosphate ABC transporter ATP-binding protein n=1 Tax=Domibacillus aminovorans TaxID=29332 RepID=A0A177L6X0_9BACI|nr:ABC transporter ATP-binding protein [Domibacillus aminovorans]OAH61097.1 glycerol-3-phosphate ABC transporter ATP-binding protein [Domibacillus aminovorans]
MKRVELKEVRKSYDRRTDVLSGIDVTIEPGEFFVLVGPSGCGKSTILRIIAGLENVTGGELRIGGKRANHLLPSQRDLSMVFQNYVLYPHLTVQENITFGLHVKRLSKAEQKQRCLETAEILGLTDYLKRKPKEISRGHRQRVALARAIVTHAPICLMDEPLSNLEAKLRTKIRSEIRGIQQKLGMTMIYVTNDQTEAMTVADRLMILNSGEVQQIGKPLHIYNYPVNTFVASFIGARPMNLIEAEVNGSSLIVDEWTVPMSDMIDLIGKRKRVMIGVRPENIRAARQDEPGFDVTVANVEVQGTETLITFHMGSSDQWIARLAGQWNLEVGKSLSIYIEDQHLCFFDTSSSQRIISHAEKLANFRGDLSGEYTAYRNKVEGLEQAVGRVNV